MLRRLVLHQLMFVIIVISIFTCATPNWTGVGDAGDVGTRGRRTPGSSRTKGCRTDGTPVQDAGDGGHAREVGPRGTSRKSTYYVRGDPCHLTCKPFMLA